MPPGRDIFKSAALLGALAALVVFCGWLQWWWNQQSLDVSVYWEAWGRMRLGGALLYTDAADPANRVGQFIYPPLFATIFAPLTWLPRWAGYATWTVAQLALLVAAFEGARRLAHVADRRDLALWLLAALWGALWMNLLEGQVNLLVAALIVWGLLWFEKGWTWRGALAIAAAIHIKIVPVVLLPVLIVQGRFRAAVAVAAGCALLWLAPLVWTVPAEGISGGVERLVTLSTEYSQTIAAPRIRTQDTDSLGGVRAPNNGLPAMWRRYFGDGERLSYELEETAPLVATMPGALGRWGGLALAAALGIGALVLARLRRQDGPRRTLAAGLALMAGMMGNLLFWPHHMCVAVVALAPLWALTRRKAWCWALAGLLLVLAWLPINEKTPLFSWMGALGTPTLAILAAWAMGAWVLLRAPLREGDSGLYSRAHEQTSTGNPAS